MSTTDEKRNTMQALFACVATGKRFYDAIGVNYSNYYFIEHIESFTPEVKNAVCASRKEAIEVGAYFIERPMLYNGRYGWRLCSFMPGTSGAHSYSGEVFAKASEFWNAMRTVEDMVNR